MSKNMSKCYLCGSTENLTRDHIPPQGLFPPPLPTNLITLPCCEKCHKPFSLEDEAFRIWVASVANASDAGRWIWKNRVVESSFRRSSKLLKNVRKFAEISQLRLPDRIVPVFTLGIPQERAQTVLIRITKGLLTHFYPYYDFSNDVFKVFCPAPIPKHNVSVQALMKVCKHDSRGDGVFDFWHGITVEGIAGCWVYFFYQAACCVVVHTST
jgi:hypothetical protein